MLILRALRVGVKALYTINNLLQTWKDVQSHLGKTGTDSFRYRVVKRDDSAVDAALIAHARNILNTVPLESAENLSLLVNVFYR